MIYNIVFYVSFAIFIYYEITDNAMSDTSFRSVVVLGLLANLNKSPK